MTPKKKIGRSSVSGRYKATPRKDGGERWVIGIGGKETTSDTSSSSLAVIHTLSRELHPVMKRLAKR